MNVTTRRFPRVSERECWRGVWEPPHRDLADRVWDAVFVTLLAAAAGVGIFMVLSS